MHRCTHPGNARLPPAKARWRSLAAIDVKNREQYDARVADDKMFSSDDCFVGVRTRCFGSESVAYLHQTRLPRSGQEAVRIRRNTRRK